MRRNPWWATGEESYDRSIDDADIICSYPLPYMQRFGSNSRKDDNCPYLKFIRYVQKQIKRKGPPAARDIILQEGWISNIIVHNVTAEQLNREVIKWMPKFRGYLKNGTRGFSTDYSFLHLQCAPGIANSENIEPGRVYIIK